MVPSAEGEDTGRSAWLNAVDRFGDYWMLGVFVIMVLVFGFLSPSHDLFTRASWLNISQYAVEFLLLAIGQTFVIITGGIDLSDGAVLGFTGMVSGVVMQGLLNAHANVTLTTVAGFATALALGALIGFVNGYLITRLKLPPFIVTLGSLTAIGAGATPLINGGNEVINLPSQIGTIGQTLIGGWIYVPVAGGGGELRGHGPGPAPHPFRVAHLLHRQQRHGGATRRHQGRQPPREDLHHLRTPGRPGGDDGDGQLHRRLTFGRSERRAQCHRRRRHRRAPAFSADGATCWARWWGPSSSPYWSPALCW